MTRPVRTLALRWAVLVVCVAFAFAPTWIRLAEEADSGAVTAYVFVFPVLAVVAGQGTARRREGELPIHDRQTDLIVGGIGALLALAVQALWLPRYSDQYALLHIDLAAVVLFTLSGAIMLFGLRPVGQFWPILLLAFAMSPMLYRLLAVSMGGSRFAYGMVLVLVAGVAGAIAVGRTRGRAALGFLVTVAVGAAVLQLLLVLDPTIDIVLLQLIPTVGASAATGTLFYLLARRGRSKRPLGRPVGAPSVKSARSAVITLVVVAVALVTRPLPAPPPPVDTVGPPGVVAAALAAPTGWRLLDDETYPWVRSYFGQRSSLVRQELQAAVANPEWDVRGRPRTVVVDTLTTTNAASLAVYPERTLYRLASTRSSPELPVELGHGVTASLHTSVDDTLLLTWTKLVFDWVRDGVFQRITIISVDNHEPGAEFPEPTPSMASNLSSVFAVFLRGNTVVGDDDPDFDDRGLLASVGASLVDAQFPAGMEDAR
ncbi:MULTISPECIES: hypothetical protein [Nocardiaceae]|uniref:Exosortase/archaeosortase family protein n=1 Tax=Rhodococcoides corynebacterioides TaxID=53972 RepID=A0ABS2KWD4_9NOCA|nr:MULTISPECIES: hypothetical protein [Rhodococcus]MBM7416232.1 hypothetical protein [Rhodococcus corynebacterioides]MBP1114485.1 hypothetical protein [Rhodococcus sp. PvP016]